MVNAKAILKIVPMTQSIALAKSIGKDIWKDKERVLKPKDMVKSATRVLIGVPLIKVSADAIESIE